MSDGDSIRNSCDVSVLCTILSFPGGASLTSPTWQCTQPGGAMAWPPSCSTTWSKPTWARTSPCMSLLPTQPYCSIKSLDLRWLQVLKWKENIINVKKKVEEFVSNFYTRYLPPDSHQSPHALFLRWRVATIFPSYHCLFRLARWGFITSQETTVILKTFTIIKRCIKGLPSRPLFQNYKSEPSCLVALSLRQRWDQTIQMIWNCLFWH